MPLIGIKNDYLNCETNANFLRNTNEYEKIYAKFLCQHSYECAFSQILKWDWQKDLYPFAVQMNSCRPQHSVKLNTHFALCLCWICTLFFTTNNFIGKLWRCRDDNTRKMRSWPVDRAHQDGIRDEKLRKFAEAHFQCRTPQNVVHIQTCRGNLI